MREQDTFQWDDIHFVLDFYSSSSLQNKSAGRHVAPIVHINFQAIQSMLLCHNAVCLAEKLQIPIHSFWFDQTWTHDHYIRGEHTPHYTIDAVQ